jgi:hypothetical protein
MGSASSRTAPHRPQPPPVSHLSSIGMVARSHFPYSAFDCSEFVLCILCEFVVTALRCVATRASCSVECIRRSVVAMLVLLLLLSSWSPCTNRCTVDVTKLQTASVEELVQSRSGMQQPRWLSSAEDYREGHSGRGTDSQTITSGGGSSSSSSSRGVLSADPGPLLRGGSGGSSSNSFCFPYSAQADSASPTLHAEVEAGGAITGTGQAGSSSSNPYPSTSSFPSGRTGPSREIHEEDDRTIFFGEGSRQSLDDERLHVACATTLRRQRVNEMQERLRRCAGFPPALDLHELERRGLMASESIEAQRRMEVMSGSVHQGLFSSSSGRDPHDMPGWAAPSFMQALDHSDLWEGSYIGPSSTVASSGRASPPMGNDSLGMRRGSTSGRESRRTSGRRLWDALSRATSHRRSAASSTAAVSDDNEPDAMAIDDVENVVEVGSLHGSRALDLEERRRRVRSQVCCCAVSCDVSRRSWIPRLARVILCVVLSLLHVEFEFSVLVQVWALRRLSNGLEGVPWHSRTCSGNHHGHRCSCDAQGMVDDTNTRASISRIIMLAEALFEVRCK